MSRTWTKRCRHLSTNWIAMLLLLCSVTRHSTGGHYNDATWFVYPTCITTKYILLISFINIFTNIIFAHLLLHWIVMCLEQSINVEWGSTDVLARLFYIFAFPILAVKIKQWETWKENDLSLYVLTTLLTCTNRLHIWLDTTWLSTGSRHSGQQVIIGVQPG